MYLTRHKTYQGPRWAIEGHALPELFSLGLLLALHANDIPAFLNSMPTEATAMGDLLPPLEPMHEVWASGVTYLRSRDARQAESETGDVYTRVYNAERPELFFKSLGWRVIGHGGVIHVRADSKWDVPEPELTLVINRHLDIVGYCAGNDVSSRSIEGENPLYLPQAKVYNGSCALGPGIQLVSPEQMDDLAIQMEIYRDGGRLFRGETRTSQMKRRLGELATYLGRELDFPSGVFLMTGTGLVPPDEFTLTPGDTVRITIGPLVLENQVE